LFIRHNGVTEEQLKEVIFHSALYCGLPAANSAFHIAAEIIAARPECKGE
jgi:alkylhydroperoxidase/carboxymuconolactone decarboxylase family protein YurZ